MNDLTLNFRPEGLLLLNACIAFIMFSVALNLKLDNLRYILRNPKSVLVGIVSQYLFLPLLTVGLILIIQPEPALAAGMLLLSACPGGNVSNFFSLVGKGNIELSITLTTISSLSSALVTPLLFTLLASVVLDDGFHSAIELPFLPTIRLVALIILLPAITGIFVSKRFPVFASKANKPLQSISMLVLVGFIAHAFIMNSEVFKATVGTLLWLIILHNTIAYSGGRLLGWVFRRPSADQLTIGLETSTQNTALGLVIVFNFFDANGPMSFILALWGVWHLLSGYGFASLHRVMTKA